MRTASNCFGGMSFLFCLVATTAPAGADVITAIWEKGNTSFSGKDQIVVNKMTTGPFSKTERKNFFVTFSAECAVDAPAGNFSAWVDIDIVVLDPNGVVIYTLPQTEFASDAFCASNGTAGFDGWESNAFTAFGGARLASGRYRVQVRARLNGGATGGWFGERSLVVWE